MLQWFRDSVVYATSCLLVATAAADPILELQAFTETYCLECHSAARSEAGFTIDSLWTTQTPSLSSLEDFESVLSFEEMPPADAEQQPAPESYATMLNHIVEWKNQLKEKSRPPPTASIRRLSNYEIEKKIESLTGQRIDTRAILLPDPAAGEGFSNVDAALFFDADRLERVIQLAEHVAERAILSPGTGIKFGPMNAAPLTPSSHKAENARALWAFLNTKLEAHVPETVADLRVADYLEAAWRVQHSDADNVDQFIEQIAREKDLAAPTLERYLSFLNNEATDNRLTQLITNYWQTISAPGASQPRFKDTAWQIEGWYEPYRGAIPVHLQRDIEVDRARRYYRWVPGVDEIYLVAGSAGDGARGDVVTWRHIVFSNDPDVFALPPKERRWKSYHQWLERTLQEDLAKWSEIQQSGVTEESEILRKRIDRSVKVSQEWYKRQTDQNELRMQAPEILALPVPEGAKWFQFIGQATPSEEDAPHTSLQFYPSIYPVRSAAEWVTRENVYTTRGSQRHKEIMADFRQMKRWIPHSFEARIKAAANSFLRKDASQTKSPGQEPAPGSALYPVDTAAIIASWDTESRKTYDALMLDRSFFGVAEEDRGANWLKHMRAHLESPEFAWVDSVELDPWLESGLKPEDAIRGVIAQSIASPEFLLVSEEGLTANQMKAQRLSYFLWSMAPDPELEAWATSEEPANLPNQIDRMLADPRAVTLAETFAGEWLGFSQEAIPVEAFRAEFPDFNEPVAQAMRAQMVAFFSDFFQNNRSISDLYKSTRSFPNPVLSDFAGATSAQRPGGLVTMPWVLTHTSFPHRPSPVKRGTWILERLMGDAPPPPPPDVPVLETAAISASMTVEQQLAVHRDNPACANCHQRIDPLGLALEGYDPVGRHIPDKDSKEILNILHEARDKITQQFVRKLLGYALRRELTLYDLPLIERLSDHPDQTVADLIKEIVQSPQFSQHHANN